MAESKIDIAAASALHTRNEIDVDSLPAGFCVVIIADLHGHLDQFNAAVKAARASVGEDRHLVVVTLGDYVDNGRQVSACALART